MCGIAGVIGPDLPGLRGSLEAAHGALRHRGPDAEGRWEQTHAGRAVMLAHRRLAIIDLSPDANQPMLDPQTGNVIVFNGEIYNFAELREQLRGEGQRFATRSDTEVLLKAYAAWGARCVDRLRGMFAFAVWDAADRSLFLARDRMGIKPLYYTEVDRDGERTFVFASEVRAMLASGQSDRRIDPVALESYLWNGFVVGPNTIVEGVRLLPAGTTLTVGLDAKTGVPRPFTVVDEVPSSATATEVEEELARAVAMRLVADVPVGVFLSGGVDSSAVATLAAERLGGEGVKTFNVSFDEPEFDESGYARAVAAALGTDHRDIRLHEATFAAQLESALACIDQPTFDAINTYFVSRAVREAGVTVALAGTGGDELFGGYSSFRDIPSARRYARAASVIPPMVRGAAARAVTRMKVGPSGEVAPQTRWGKLEDVLATGGQPLALYQTSYSLFTRRFGGRLRPFAGNGRLTQGLPTDRARQLESSERRGTLLATISRFEQRLFLGERLLRDTDAASMAVALEVRVPLVDHRFVAAAESLSDGDRFGTLGRKQLLRRIASRRVDASLFDRPKSGFVLPIERWCRQRLRDELDAVFHDRPGCESVGLDAAAVQALWRAYLADAPGIYWSRVWALFILLRYCREHRLNL